jgi:hypothetical protein
VTLVQLRALRLEGLVTRDVPGVIGHGDPNRVARVDLEDRIEVGREVAVQVSLLERQLVDGH